VRWALAGLALAMALATTRSSRGDETAGADEPSAAVDADDADEPSDDAPKAKKKKHAEKKPKADGEAREGYPPEIDPKEGVDDYFFIGLRWRDVIVPGFQIRVFADGGPDVANAFHFGAELTYRNNGVEIIPALSYGDWSLDSFLFKAKDDPDRAFERVDSSLKVVWATVDFLFEVWVEDQSRFAFLIGGGIGIGFVADDLRRRQVYPRNPGGYDPEDPSQFEDCRAPGDPSIPESDGQWCDNDNERYGDYSEPSWANGGSKPIVVPWLAPQLSFRYKPIKQLQVRADAGWSLTGFFVGMSHAYGF
jgi:hypothetical protein